MVPIGHDAGGTAIGAIVWAVVQSTLMYEGDAVPGALVHNRGSAKVVPLPAAGSRQSLVIQFGVTPAVMPSVQEPSGTKAVWLVPPGFVQVVS